MSVKAYVAGLMCSCGAMCVAQIDQKSAETFLQSKQTNNDFSKVLNSDDKIQFARFLLQHYAHNIKKAIGALVDNPKDKNARPN